MYIHDEPLWLYVAYCLVHFSYKNYISQIDMLLLGQTLTNSDFSNFMDEAWLYYKYKPAIITAKSDLKNLSRILSKSDILVNSGYKPLGHYYIRVSHTQKIY